MRVTLTSPFPSESLPDLFRWLAHSTISKSGAFPSDLEAFEKISKQGMENVKNWAVHHEGKLIGAVIFEPLGLMGGRAYVASSRSVWGTGLMDEAALEGIRLVFDSDPRISYIFSMVIANNAPALSFNRRIGLRLKNVLPLYGMHNGRTLDMNIFEITREQFEARRIFEATRPKCLAA
jgi:RimJ/RimL family protein N-acetyltransferase